MENKKNTHTAEFKMTLIMLRSYKAKAKQSWKKEPKRLKTMPNWKLCFNIRIMSFTTNDRDSFAIQLWTFYIDKSTLDLNIIMTMSYIWKMPPYQTRAYESHISKSCTFTGDDLLIVRSFSFHIFFLFLLSAFDTKGKKIEEKTLQNWISVSFFFSKSHEYWIMIALVLMMRTNPIFILAAIHIDSNIKCYSTKSVPCICFEFFVYWLYTAAHKLHWNWNKILKTCGTTTFKWCCCCCSTIHIFKINANKVRPTRTHKANNKSILKCDASIVTNARFLFAHIVIRIDVLLFTTPFS